MPDKTKGIKAYRKGRRKEYAVIDKLRDDFDILQRSKGSHSPIDILAINKEKKIIKLIQVKQYSFSEKQKENLLEENKGLNGNFKVEFVVM